MISVFIHSDYDKYLNDIRFAFEQLLNTLGYNWKILEKDEAPSRNDILIYYAPELPAKDYIEPLILKIPVIFILSDADFFQPGKLNQEIVKNRIKEFTLNHKEMNLAVTLPIITNATYKYPLAIDSVEGKTFGIFEFDIIGNLFYHLSNTEFVQSLKKDKNHRLPDEMNNFSKYKDSPYINTYFYLFDQFILELNNRRTAPLVQKALWPSNESFSAQISHNVNRLQKWTIPEIFKTFCESFFLFLTLKWDILFRQIFSIIKYLLTNIEPYWVFEELAECEKKYGFRTTWFLGQKSQDNNIDYDLHEHDLENELKELVHYGSELAYLSTEKKYAQETFVKDYQEFQGILKINDCGIRNICELSEWETRNQMMFNMGFSYDSSMAFTSQSGFYNGWCLPHRIYIKNRKTKLHYYEVPIHFSDEILKISKYKDIPIEVAKNRAKELIKIAKYYHGSIHFSFSTNAFVDMPYMFKLYHYILDHLKESETMLFKATAKQLVTWLENRDQVVIAENNNMIVVTFPTKIDYFTLLIHGDYIISKVEGVTAEYKPTDKKIRFINILKGSTAKITLMPNKTPDFKDSLFKEE